jgi:hypothetical protein
MFRILVLSALIFFSVSVYADTYPGVGQWSYNGTQYTSLIAACDAKRADQVVTPLSRVTYTVIDNTHCQFKLDGGDWFIFTAGYFLSCPGGGTVSGSNCINATACTSPQVRGSDGLCADPVALPFCQGSENPIYNDCRYNPNEETIDCLGGSTVVPPAYCPEDAWQLLFPEPKHMCLPGLYDPGDNCEPLLFQRINEWANDHALIYGAALLAIGAPVIGPIIGTSLAVLDAATAIVSDSVLYADYTVLSRTASGEMTDALVRAEIPKPTFGDAMRNLIEHNPTSPYVSGLPDAINGASASNAPQVIRDGTTGELKYTGDDSPISNNRIADITKALHNDYPIPQAELAPYIVAENIPWLKFAEPAIKYDLLHVDTPAYFPISPIADLPVSVTTSQIIRTASPLSPYSTTTGQPPVIVAAPSQITVRQLQPFVTLTPSSPTVYAPVISTPSSLPAPTNNPNPLGTDAPTPPSVPPDSNLPVNPGDSFLPPQPPTVFPDTYKYFDFLPTANPFAWDVTNFMPQLPTTSCSYEIHETFNVPFLGVKHFDVAPCVPLEPLRQVLQWAFAVLTAISCFMIMTRATFR